MIRDEECKYIPSEIGHLFSFVLTYVHRYETEEERRDAATIKNSTCMK
jgi:hypothetical protein